MKNPFFLPGSLTKFQVVILTILWSGAVRTSNMCHFNSMCACKGSPHLSDNSSRDIICVGVPFSRLPELSGTRIENIDIMETGLEVIEGDSLSLPLLTSLRLVSNQLQLVSSKAFLSTSKALRSLDLSYNKLDSVPLDALRHLKTLDWLNLHGNHISSLDENSDWGGLRHSLTSLFLGENDLRDLGPDFPLSHFRKLTSVSLDHNKFLGLDPSSLPPTVQTLSASHNLIKRFPVELVDNLKSISWLYLRDNFIEAFSPYNFRHSKKLDKLDLGDNFLATFPLEAFNNTSIIRDLNLEQNYFKTIPSKAFKGLTINRISLSKNKLVSVHENAFDGLENSLEYLDLGSNYLQKVPRALGSLTRLKYLYMPSNNLSFIQSEAMASFSSALSALSLSGNKLEEIPKLALKKCLNLGHLNLGYNYIRELTDNDLQGWADRLDTLLLMNNRIVQIHSHTFRHSPNLRELSLSFNKIADIHPGAFVDLATSMESLEISFGLYQEDFPQEPLRPLVGLVWLALDNNNFRSISDSSLRNFRHLRYLNLDGNRLSKLPVGIFNPEIHTHLRDVRVSFNILEGVDSYLFEGLDELQFIALAGNQMTYIAMNSFKNLTNQLTILLSENKINSVAPRAFSEIPRMLKLDLHGNELQELSLASFFNVSSPDGSMVMNLSRNVLNSLIAPDNHHLYLQVLDLSYNLLAEVPRLFLEATGSTLRRIHLGFNHITKLSEMAFGELELLEALTIEHNSIIKLRKRAFIGMRNLQILDLSHNHVEQLHMEQFKHLPNLRVMDLSFNHIRSIPRDAFQNTKLERLDLSHNEFLVVPSASLGEVGFTLRVLDVSHNQIDHLDSSVFPETPHLTSLNLCHNRISLVPDNVFTSVGNLLTLELCGNRLRANFKELFHYLQSLRTLNLADSGIHSVPHLPLPNLVILNVSSNPISEFPIGLAASLPRLRTLLMAHCKFYSVPSHAWMKLRYLKHLDISSNPIKALTKESFTGLGRLDRLEMDRLDFLEQVEPDALWGCRWLRQLTVESHPQLGDLLSSLTFLTRLTIHVVQRRLTSQLSKMPSKLTYLELRGETLKEIEPHVLQGLNSEAVLVIRGTSVEELPLGLLSSLRHVGHLTLDVRDNKIASLSPDTFYYNLTTWENIGTKLISGGLLLAGNPLLCDCSLVWIGHWLRRWVRESLLIHTVDSETGLRLIRAVREATCRDRAGRSVPLLDLHPEQLSCHASALSSSPSTFPSSSLLFLTFLILR